MASLIRTIVVGVASMELYDPRPEHTDEDPVLRPAADLARRLGAALHVVHAFALPDRVLMAWPAAAGTADPTYHLTYSSRLESQLQEQVSRFPGGAAARCHAVEGPPSTRLCQAAGEMEADLLVVGASRRGHVWRGILGSTAARVVRQSPVPVLVVSRPLAPPPRRVLFAVDLSELGGTLFRRGLEHVGRLFAPGQVELRAVNVVSYDRMLPPPVPEAELAAGARRELRRLMEANVPELEPMDVGVRIGDPVWEVVHEADEWNADLLVAGSQAGTRPNYGFAGGTVSSILRQAPCNVLVVPPERRGVRPAAPVAEPAGAGFG